MRLVLEEAQPLAVAVGVARLDRQRRVVLPPVGIADLDATVCALRIAAFCVSGDIHSQRWMRLLVGGEQVVDHRLDGGLRLGREVLLHVQPPDRLAERARAVRSVDLVDGPLPSVALLGAAAQHLAVEREARLVERRRHDVGLAVEVVEGQVRRARSRPASRRTASRAPWIALGFTHARTVLALRAPPLSRRAAHGKPGANALSSASSSGCRSGPCCAPSRAASGAAAIFVSSAAMAVADGGRVGDLRERQHLLDVVAVLRADLRRTPGCRSGRSPGSAGRGPPGRPRACSGWGPSRRRSGPKPMGVLPRQAGPRRSRAAMSSCVFSRAGTARGPPRTA